MYKLAVLITEKYQPADAVKIGLLFTEIYPELFAAYNVLGDAYIRTGEKDMAAECYQKALKFKPDDSYPREELKKLGKER